MAYGFVQQVGGNGGSSGTSVASGAFGANTTAGNLIIAVVQWHTTSTVSVSDGINTYLPIGTPVTDGTGGYIGLFYASNIAGGSTTQLTANFGTSQSGSAGIGAFEYSGLDTSAPYTTGELAQNHSATFGTGTDAITTGNTPALSAQPAMLFGIAQNSVNNAHSASAGTGFTARTAIFPGGLKSFPEDIRLTSTSAVAATWTTSLGGTDSWNLIAAVFKEAGGGGGGGGATQGMAVGMPGPGVGPFSNLQFTAAPRSSYIAPFSPINPVIGSLGQITLPGPGIGPMRSRQFQRRVMDNGSGAQAIVTSSTWFNRRHNKKRT